MQERDVRGVHTALEPLQVIALLIELRHEPVRVGHVRPLELGQRRRRHVGSHVRPHHPASFRARIAALTHLLGESAPRRLVRHVDALPIQCVLPPVIHAPQPRALVASKKQRRPPMRTELGKQPRLTPRRPEHDEVLSQQPHPLHSTARLELVRPHDRNPVLPHERAHRRPRPHPRQQLILIPGQHAVALRGASPARKSTPLPSTECG
jgi:hypothetical protein